MYAPAISAHSITAMPAAVYTALADPDLRYYKVPRGRYTVSTDFDIQKPDFDLDWNGSTIIYTPDTTSLFEINSVVDAFVDATSPTRNASHLTGTITAATTTLTMDAAEIMDVTPGEVVSIVAGVNTSDPLEPFKYITATVLSVAGQVITFTAPLGVNVTTYANEAALEAVVSGSLHDRIGPWGDDYASANYMKGLGIDHGLLRFVGGMNHDVTVRNFHLEITLPADASMPISAGQSFSCRDVLNLTIKNFSMMNIVAAPIHTWRCDNFLAENFKLRGTARTAFISSGTTIAGWMMTAWGGSGITYKNGNVNCRNITFSNTEVSPSDVLFQNIRFVSNIVDDWSYGGEAVVMGFYGTTLGSGVRIEDTYLDIQGLTSAFTFDPGNTITFENLVIPNSTFPEAFSFANHTLEGTLTLGGAVYGPEVSDTETKVRSGPSNSYIHFPKGFYSFARFRVTVQGSATAVYDLFGNDYTSAGLWAGDWTNVAANSWLQIAGGTSPSTYFGNQRFMFNFSGGTACTLQFEITYLPASDDPGWVMS